MSAQAIEFSSAEWGHARVAKSDLDLLREFTGRTPEECLDRLAAHRIEDTANAWRDARPSGPQEIRKFYSETDQYLWELLGWNGSDAYKPYVRRLQRLSTLWPPLSHSTVLDYGSGVGTAALMLSDLGYEVTVADVPGRTFDFGRRRLERAGKRFHALEIVEDVPLLPRQEWDLIVSFDVLEHVVDPAHVARAIVGALKPNGGAAVVAPFDANGEAWPHHLSAGRERFHGHRWEYYLQSLGLKHRGDFIYEKLNRSATMVRKAQYGFWRATGLRIERRER
jgi:2-polyprenyl-3-methyl-5-hydroxy-6-metoxy-1,4-benzoquinol methylase